MVSRYKKSYHLLSFLFEMEEMSDTKIGTSCKEKKPDAFQKKKKNTCADFLTNRYVMKRSITMQNIQAFFKSSVIREWQTMYRNLILKGRIEFHVLPF